MLYCKLNTQVCSISVDGALFGWLLPTFTKKELIVEKDTRFLSFDIISGTEALSRVIHDYIYVLAEELNGA